MPARKIDPVLLRRWCKARLSAVEIAARFGVPHRCRPSHPVTHGLQWGSR